MPLTDWGLIYSLPEDNVAATGIAVTTGTVHSDYPLSRAVDGDPATHTFVTPSGGSIVFTWTHGATTRLDVFQINTNGLPSTATLTLTRGSQSVPMTVTQKRDGFPNNAWANLVNAANYDVGGHGSTTLTITGAGSDPVAFGEFWLGKIAYQLDPNIQWGLRLPRTRKYVRHETGYGAQHDYDLGVTIRSIIGNVNTSAAGYAQLIALWESTHETEAFFTAYDPLVNDSHIVKWGEFDPTLNFFEDIDVPVEFIELSRGLRP